jgi:hypothetical protein
MGVMHMSNSIRRDAVLLLALSLLAASCGRVQRTAGTAGEKTFASPEDAGAALVAAARSGDQSALLAIFGPDSRTALFTGEAGADSINLKNFVSAYERMHRWEKIKAGGEVLQVGADNYPFPIPLDKNSAGRWYFDTAAGKDEILARRIGKNELTAIDASEAIAGAQREYYKETHDGEKVKRYAEKFLSDPGKHNGLYWPVAEGQTPSPLGRLGDFARVQAVRSEVNDAEFNGYRYRILSKQSGGFGVLAYPADYRNSGIMSFLTGADGTVYQKDLGPRTAETAAAMTDSTPAEGWTQTRGPATSASRMQ